jgi:hypothetical protein
MIPSDPALAFALTLKRWFASNDWPQKITDDWARDAGNSSGPWASQVCNAMKAAGYNPKAEFFLSLATFNQVVASQELLGITDTKLKDRLTGASPLCLENGQPYGGAEFWSLYAGLIEPPAAFAKSAEFTEEDAADWVRLQRDNFRRVSLKEMCSRAEAWELVKAKMAEVGERDGVTLAPEDVQWTQEVLAGVHDPDAAELNRTAKRYPTHNPLAIAMEELLGAVNSGKEQAIA